MSIDFKVIIIALLLIGWQMFRTQREDEERARRFKEN